MPTCDKPNHCFLHEASQRAVVVCSFSLQSLSSQASSFFILFISVWSPAAEDWKAANEELQKSCRYIIKNLTTGERLKIRVVAVNAGGRSPPAALPEAVLVKEVAGRKPLGICPKHHHPFTQLSIFCTRTTWVTSWLVHHFVTKKKSRFSVEREVSQRLKDASSRWYLSTSFKQEHEGNRGRDGTQTKIKINQNILKYVHKYTCVRILTSA